MALAYVELTEEDLQLFVPVSDEIQQAFKGGANIREAKSLADLGVIAQYYQHILNRLTNSMKRHKEHSDKIMGKAGYSVPEPIPNSDYILDNWLDWETFLYAEFAYIEHYKKEPDKTDEQGRFVEGDYILTASKFSLNLIQEFLDKVKTWDFPKNKYEWPKITKE